MTARFRPLFSLALVGLISPAFAAEPVGALRLVRVVSVSGDGGKTFATPRTGATVESGTTVRVGGRSLAEIGLAGGGALRLDSRSEATLASADSATLNKGMAYVRSTKPFRLVTPSASAIVQKGIALVTIPEAGRTVVTSLGGEVEVEQDEARVTLKPGEFIEMAKSAVRKLRGTPVPVPSDSRPTELGGPLDGWWNGIEKEDGMLVFPGSASARALRFDPITEAVAEIAAIPPTPASIAEDADRRAKLLAIAQTGINPTLDAALAADPTLSLGGYRNKFATAYVTDKFNLLTKSNKQFLRGNGLNTVDQLFTALSASGGSFGAPTPSLKTEYKLFDRNKDSSAYFLAGAVASLVTGGGTSWSAPRPSASAYGILSDTQAFGGRVELTGAGGKTRYQIEANTLNLTGSALDPSSTNGLTQAYVERELSGGLTAFAGRKRFYTGPVLQNQTRSQLLADRYTGAGIEKRSGKSTLTVGFLHDANPDRRDAQSGALASLTTRQGGGTVGFHFLTTKKTSEVTGPGFTVSASQPLSPGQLDGYAEVGRGIDGEALATVGVYLAGLYQRTGVDAWLEAGTHAGYASALSLGLAKQSGQNLTWRAFATLNDREGRNQNGKFGFGAMYKYH